MCTLGAGTDSYGRITVDSNTDFDNGTAFRINAMVHQNDVPGRDVEKFERWGIAPSLAFGLGTDTRFTLSYFHQNDDNIPQYGVPYYRNASTAARCRASTPENYYGYHNIDKQEIEVDMLTGVFEHDFSDDIYAAQPGALPEGRPVSHRRRAAGHLVPRQQPDANAARRASSARAVQPSRFPSASTCRAARAATCATRSNAIAISQTDLTTRFNTGAVEHALVAGVSFSREAFDLDTGNLFRNADGSNPFVATPFDPAHLPFMDIADPDSLYTGPINKTLIGRTEGTLRQPGDLCVRHARVQRAVDAEPRRALRAQRRRLGHLERQAVHGADGGRSQSGQHQHRRDHRPCPSARNEDDLFSYRAGLVFKPVENGSDLPVLRQQRRRRRRRRSTARAR